MVEGRSQLEPEVQEILECIDSQRHFLLSGGAGSGKTYSLVQVIKQVIKENNNAKVACMTYTNAAVHEIEQRVNHSNLNVSTIHDFLWDNIKHFQKELKNCLIELLNNPDITRLKIEDIDVIPSDFFDMLEDGIQYKEFLRIKDGIISHDELLIVADLLFDKHPKMSGIIKDKYQYIFLDEYQDTNKLVIKILLQHFKKSDKKNIIGFFGDAMQSIYDDGIGNLDDYKGEEDDKIKEIKKSQNRRNPRTVIALANLLRTDGIKQVPSTDNDAPNMLNGQIKEGTVKFIYSSNPDFIQIKKYLTETYAWPCNDPKETKELNLTHNLIADKAEFRTLMDIYDRDQILAYKTRIKRYVRERSITQDFTGFTFGQVIEFLKQGKSGTALNAVLPTAGMKAFIEANKELYETALGLDYSIFSRTYVDKDQLLDDKKQTDTDESRKGSKRDRLMKHLFKIQKTITFYINKQYNEFLRATDFINQIISIEQKQILKDNINALINVGDKTIEEVILDANEKGICVIDDSLEKFQQENSYIYNRVKKVKYTEFQKLYNYLEGHTPFSTQHKTKGAEFNTVLVILDNGGWNHYNFENLFLQTGSESVLNRTQKIFYVCCTRAKENLAIFFYNPNTSVIEIAKRWFGDQNVLPL